MKNNTPKVGDLIYYKSINDYFLDYKSINDYYLEYQQVNIPAGISYIEHISLIKNKRNYAISINGAFIYLIEDEFKVLKANLARILYE